MIDFQNRNAVRRRLEEVGFTGSLYGMDAEVDSIISHYDPKKLQYVLAKKYEANEKEPYHVIPIPEAFDRFYPDEDGDLNPEKMATTLVAIFMDDEWESVRRGRPVYFCETDIERMVETQGIDRSEAIREYCSSLGPGFKQRVPETVKNVFEMHKRQENQTPNRRAEMMV